MGKTREVGSRSRRELRTWVLSLGALAVLALLHACRHEASRAAAESAEKPSASGGDQLAAPEFHEDAFDLVMRPVGTYRAGQPGAVEVVLSAKGGYHCNDKYPYKFKATLAPGVKFSAPVLTKEAVQLEQLRALLKVDFTPEGSGNKTIGGLFAFSLCDPERCLVEKRDLARTVAVD